MIRLEAEQGSPWVTVTFTVPEDGVDGEVAVVGDFNRWEPTATLMRGHAGERTASVTVEAGRRYAFRYLAEGGRWFNDEAAHDYQPNEYGGSDGVIDLHADMRSGRRDHGRRKRSALMRAVSLEAEATPLGSGPARYRCCIRSAPWTHTSETA